MTGKIPNIIYFCFGLQPQTTEFLFSYYVAILSAQRVNKPESIRILYHHMPHGEWWDQVQDIPNVELWKIDVPTHIGKHEIKKTAHRADIARMRALFETGGVYMDIDTISHRPYTHMLKNDVVLGREFPDGICNAIMMTSPKSEFFRLWLDNYEQAFNPDGWREASIKLPEQIHKQQPELAVVVRPDVFFLPNWNETHKIFTGTMDIPPALITLHLWEKFSLKYLNRIQSWDWCDGNETLYGKLLASVKRLI